MHHRVMFPALIGIVAGMTLLPFAPAGAQTTTPDKTLSPDTHFFIAQASDGSAQQVLGLVTKGQFKNAALIVAMELVPQAIWVPTDSPSHASNAVKKILVEAAFQKAVPALVLYNIPGRDCGSYSAGGAQNTAAYEQWVDAIAKAIGSSKVVVILEPDGLALLPSDCGYDPTQVNIPQAVSDRYTQINYAVTTLEANPRTLVYLDAGHSAWHAVGDMAVRLVNGGLASAQGFYSNASNYRATNYETKFDTWISECIAFANDPEQGGWRLGNYSWCASQYYSPDGLVNPSDISTWVYTDDWYAANMGTAVPATHFIVDTSRNGQGPFDASSYVNAPYDQPASVIQVLNSGNWCNPPARGLGYRTSANTKVPLLDAYLWIKVPGQSDGSCDAQGGARAWDYSAYTQAKWPTTAAAQALFDPLWGLDDPAAGDWFPQQALDLAQRANPSLLPKLP